MLKEGGQISPFFQQQIVSDVRSRHNQDEHLIAIISVYIMVDKVE